MRRKVKNEREGENCVQLFAVVVRYTTVVCCREMMPKAVTPLTWSVFLLSVETSLQVNSGQL